MPTAGVVWAADEVGSGEDIRDGGGGRRGAEAEGM